MISVGQVRWAFIPYNDSPPHPGERDSKGKTRPVVVLGWNSFSDGDSSILVVPVYTHGNGSKHLRPGEVRIGNYEELGLSPQARIQPFKVIALHPTSIDFSQVPAGNITPEAMENVIHSIGSMFMSVGEYTKV
ncbi:type II toxin-antitoxin system PemK/MazF family toxin [Nesterenkonia jeotgali]|uniref:Growth inhibitor PemK n=1 Tax=Nesterenkonia jeotgali TaxID=317018 RepID=A0A839FLZ7_9MICC|nr:type II toxin-antitoxin system PemK/MazF family toxin [Nesterenkonia jeotgali]MBA8920455.1 hypothetical protein [Nesterenkonia jeotgali]